MVRSFRTIFPGKLSNTLRSKSVIKIYPFNCRYYFCGVISSKTLLIFYPYIFLPTNTNCITCNIDAVYNNFL
jgi:hypothetical protein